MGNSFNKANLGALGFALADHSGAEYHPDLETGNAIFVKEKESS